MRNRFLLLSFGLIGVMISAGCNMPTPCTSDTLVQPQLQSPGMWEVVDTLTPSLSWNYPASAGAMSAAPLPKWIQRQLKPVDIPFERGPILKPGGGGGWVPYPYPLHPYPWPGGGYPGGGYPGGGYPDGGYPATACYPSGYEIKLAAGPNFDSDIGGSSTETNWTTPTLLPGTEYAWGVRATSSGGSGPFAGYRYFITGPICECSPETLQAPNLLGPSDTQDSLYPSFTWDYPGDCAAPSYRIDLSTDPSFTDTSLSGGTGNPSTRWGAGEDLLDCATYYWRVAVACETASGETILGPYSEVQSFNTQSMDVCPTLTPLSPHFIPGIDANCRKGPDTLYGLVGVAVPGEQLPILGRNPAGDWYYVNLRDNIFCWIADRTGDVEGDSGQTPLVEYPPLDTRKPGGGSGCSKYNDYKSCVSDVNCSWDRVTNTCSKK